MASNISSSSSSSTLSQANTRMIIAGERIDQMYENIHQRKMRRKQTRKNESIEVDFYVNAGTGRGAKYLQTVVGATADGAIGPNTLRQVDEFVALRGEEDLVVAYSDARRRYYKKLRTFDTFGRGWLRRVDETEIEALKLAGVYLQS